MVIFNILVILLLLWIVGILYDILEELKPKQKIALKPSKEPRNPSEVIVRCDLCGTEMSIPKTRYNEKSEYICFECLGKNPDIIFKNERRI